MNLLSVVKWVITVWMLVIAPATCNIVMDLNKPSNYAKFVTEVRNAIKDPTTTHFGLPVIKPNPNPKFIFIEIKVNKNKQNPAISVTLQLRVSDLYLVAYRDKDTAGRFRYFYFRSVNILVSEVFPQDGRNITPELMGCDHNYASIEGTAKKEIKNLVFNFPNLEAAMRNAYGKSTALSDFANKQALFLLHTILMTSEATRFKYIEQKTVKKQNSDVKVASLVKEWNKLSVQIIGADRNTGQFARTIRIQIAENPNKFLDVTKVNDIKSDMGILKR